MQTGPAVVVVVGTFGPNVVVVVVVVVPVQLGGVLSFG